MSVSCLIFFLSPFFGAFIQQLYIIYYSRWLIFIYSMLLAKQHINWCSWMTYSDILIIHGYFFSLFSFSLSRLWIRICRNSISNSTQIQCQKISNYTRLSTCWFRQLVPWAVNWFIASSKETSWKNLLLILIQVCKNFLFSFFHHFICLSIHYHCLAWPCLSSTFVIMWLVSSATLSMVGVVSTTSALILLSAWKWWLTTLQGDKKKIPIIQQSPYSQPSSQFS